MKFLQKDIDKFKVCQTNESTKKINWRRKKKEAWNKGKRTQILVTVTEGLAATDKGSDRWLFLHGSSIILDV